MRQSPNGSGLYRTPVRGLPRKWRDGLGRAPIRGRSSVPGQMRTQGVGAWSVRARERGGIGVTGQIAGVAMTAVVLALSVISGPGLRGDVAGGAGTVDLSLEAYRWLVLEHNESVQVRMLELEVNRRKYRAERGIFEPELYGTYTREANRRQNTVQEQEQQLGSPVFDERNSIYEGGLESLVPTGARLRMGYTMRDLRNNLQTSPSFYSRGATNGEFQSFVGLSLTQPLLKNAWFPATLAGIRLAALSSDIAFQDYRRQLMLILSTAEASYWNLYMAQEQVRFFEQSVAVAERIFKDTRARQEVGKSAEIDVLEAEAGLALRRSKLSEAQQRLIDAANRVMSLYSGTVLATNRLVRATDQPKITELTRSFFDIWTSAADLNPDYLMQRQKLIQESIRVGYARNQRLPELNVKSSYGLNGLGETPSTSWDAVSGVGFPSWSVAVEFRVPLAGGIKTANELAAARLRQKEAALNLQDIETQVINGLDLATHKIRTARTNVNNFQTVVKFNENLLDSALNRREVGILEIRRVLEIEADLFEARSALVEALVNYERSVLEMEFLEGSILKNRKIELSQKQLQEKTAELVSRQKLRQDQYSKFIKEVRTAYENQRKSASAPKPNEGGTKP